MTDTTQTNPNTSSVKVNNLDDMKTCYCCNKPLDHSHTIVFDDYEKCFVCDASKVVVRHPESWDKSECDYVIEIYDNWRE